MCNIIASSEYEQLLEEAKRLQADLSALIMERDELKHHVCKDLQMDYMLKLGTLEYKVFELQCKILRIKRKIELIQMHFNRQEIVNIIEIECQLDVEYAQYQEQLNEKIDEINAALERNGMTQLSPDEVREIRKLYNQIVKKLHPDMNLNVTERELKLFSKAVEAYKNADLETLRSIAIMISEISDYDETTDSMNELKEKIAKLKQLITVVSNEIEKIKQSFPYNQKDLLSNPAKIEERKNELHEILEEYKEIYAIYEQKLNDMLGGNANG